MGPCKKWALNKHGNTNSFPRAENSRLLSCAKRSESNLEDPNRHGLFDLSSGCEKHKMSTSPLVRTAIYYFSKTVAIKGG